MDKDDKKALIVTLLCFSPLYIFLPYLILTYKLPSLQECIMAGDSHTLILKGYAQCHQDFDLEKDGWYLQGMYDGHIVYKR